MGLLINGEIFLVQEYHHVKPGKGAAFVRVKLRSVKTGNVLEKTFRTSDRLEDVHLEERKMQLMYRSGDTYHFMCNETYEQVEVSSDIVGDAAKFLKDDAQVEGIVYNNNVLKINLPIFITAKVTQTEPGFRGDTSKAGTKPATIDTGATIQVPLFVDIDDSVKIDTRSGEYVERVKK